MRAKMKARKKKARDKIFSLVLGLTGFVYFINRDEYGVGMLFFGLVFGVILSSVIYWFWLRTDRQDEFNFDDDDKQRIDGNVLTPKKRVTSSKTDDEQ